MPNVHHTGRRPEAGFTLVELLVSLTIFAVVAVILGTVIVSSNRTQRQTTHRADVQGASRAALSLMSAELSQAGADPRVPPTGIAAVSSADSTTVRVQADLNGDGVIQTTEPSEDVTYSYDASAKALLRNPGTGAAQVLINVTQLRFTYFDASDQPLTSLPLSASDRALVRSIGITFTCEENDSHPLSHSTKITLRNQAG
jgi:prepilin-type N-terminal cleavage/methylation domain-containing protein